MQSDTSRVQNNGTAAGLRRNCSSGSPLVDPSSDLYKQLSNAAPAKQHPNQGLTLNSLPLVLWREYLLLQPRAEVIMQNGSVIRRTRKMHSDIWQFRWRENTADGKKIYRRRQIGTIDQIPDIETARKAASLLVPDLNARTAKSKPASMTVAQLCSHFEQCELSLANTWRSYSTKTIYKVYLKRWIIPKWSEHLLSDIRTIEVESWLRSLPIARSTCAKIRNVMSVLFNHACRYEFFDSNPIRREEVGTDALVFLFERDGQSEYLSLR
jgi:hypothetical protein